MAWLRSSMFFILSLWLPRFRAYIDSYITCLMVTTRAEYSEARKMWRCIPFLVSLEYWKAQSRNSLFEFNPDRVFCFNARQMPYACFLKAAIEQSVPCYIHERNSEFGSYIIKLNEPAHKRQKLYDLLLKSKIELAHLSPNANGLIAEWAAQFYGARFTGQNLDCPYYINSSHLPTPLVQRQKQVTIFLTSTDEITPSDPEFFIVNKQWELLPEIIRWIRRDWESRYRDLPIEVRLHPNMLFRSDFEILHIRRKIAWLRNVFDDFRVVINDHPDRESVSSVISRSAVVLSLASSAALEAEFLGTPAIVPSNHIYSLACTNPFDFTLLYANSHASPGNLKIKISQPASPDRVVVFSYLFYHLQALRFSSISFHGFSKYTCSPHVIDHSPDMNMLVDSLESGDDPHLLKIKRFLEDASHSVGTEVC